MPDATPEDEPMVAIPIDVDVQVPPVGVEANAVVAPTHTFNVPVIDVGGGLIVTIYATVFTPAIAHALSLNVT